MSDRDHDEDDDELIWIPEPQREKPAFFWLHEGILGLYVRCSTCGRTTCAYPTMFVFVDCKRCGEELPVAWRVGVA